MSLKIHAKTNVPSRKCESQRRIDRLPTPLIEVKHTHTCPKGHVSHFGIKILARWFCLHFDILSCPVCVIFKRVWDRSTSSQNNLTKSRHVSNINLENFGSILPMTHMRASYVPTVPTTTAFAAASQYCIVPYVHTGRRMPKVSSFMLRAESVRIKPLQRLPTVCTIRLTPKGEHHIRPTLLPRPVLHLILVNFADNLVCLCVFQFKSAFEQI